jgi:hypothetical protein
MVASIGGRAYIAQDSRCLRAPTDDDISSAHVRYGLGAKITIADTFVSINKAPAESQMASATIQRLAVRVAH